MSLRDESTLVKFEVNLDSTCPNNGFCRPIHEGALREEINVFLAKVVINELPLFDDAVDISASSTCPKRCRGRFDGDYRGEPTLIVTLTPS